MRAGPAGKTDTAQTKEPVVGDKVAGSIHLPPRTRYLHPVMLIPGPWLGDQREARPHVTETLLQQHADIAGNKVGSGGRIAVMDDARDVRFLPALRPPQRRIKGVQRPARVLEQ